MAASTLPHAHPGTARHRHVAAGALRPVTRQGVTAAVAALHLLAGWAVLRSAHVPRVSLPSPTVISGVLAFAAAPAAPDARPAAAATPVAPAQVSTAPARRDSPRTQPARDTHEPDHRPPPPSPAAEGPALSSPATAPAAPAVATAPATAAPQPDPRPIGPAAAAPAGAASAPAGSLAAAASSVPAVPRSVAASALRYAVLPPVELPMASRRLGESGTVVLRVVFDTQGRARHVSVLRSSGHARLDEQAQQAMRQARIVPFVDNGQAIEVVATAPLAYDLE